MQKTQGDHADGRYLEVYVCELEEFTLAGDCMRGWYGYLKGGWKLQGKKVGSAQYTRDEDVNFASLLNTTSDALNRTIIEGLSPMLVALSLGDPQVVNETKKALRSMANGKAMGPDELPAELLKLGLSDSSHEILLAFDGIIVAVWMTGEVCRRSGKTLPSKFYTRRIGPSVAKTGASLWWRMLGRFSSKS